MRPTFYLKTLSVAIAALSVASVASAAGLDRSGQDVTAFFQDGLYAEAAYTYIDVEVSGEDNNGNDTGNITEDYDFFRYGVKADINDTFSVGIIYDEPYGADISYGDNNNFTTTNNTDALINATTGGAIPSLAAAQVGVAALTPLETNGTISPAQQAQLNAARGAVNLGDTAGESTQVKLSSENVTAILGMKFGPNKSFQIYGGPVAQRISSDLKLRGTAYGPASGYSANANPAQDYGYLAGISYSKPEIALKAALTYRSEIEHDITINESYPTAGLLGLDPVQTSTFEVSTPKSINFDFQTGINPTTLATAKVRWVPWSDFDITPPLFNQVSQQSFGPEGLPLTSYEDDAYVVELGLAKRLSPALALSGTVGWDSGAGNPVTTLGPTEGFYSVGLGAKYNVTPEWAISAGGKYLFIGDAEAALSSGTVVGDFQDNDGYIVGVKLSYQAKQGF